MSSQDTSDDIDKENESAMDADQNNDNDNWLPSSRRSSVTGVGGEPRHGPGNMNSDGAGSSSSQSESARTIKVRGHETLVIRKPKLVAKPSNAIDRSNQ